MKRFAVLCLASVFVAAVAITAGAQGGDTPSIKEVMRKLHKGANAPLAVLKKDLNSGSPDWETVQKHTKDFVILGASLAKNDPPKGDSASWKKLADSYFEDSKAMDDAAKEKKLDETKAAFGKVAGSCAACHKAHRG